MDHCMADEIRYRLIGIYNDLVNEGGPKLLNVEDIIFLNIISQGTIKITPQIYSDKSQRDTITQNIEKMLGDLGDGIVGYDNIILIDKDSALFLVGSPKDICMISPTGTRYNTQLFLELSVLILPSTNSAYQERLQRYVLNTDQSVKDRFHNMSVTLKMMDICNTGDIITILKKMSSVKPGLTQNSIEIRSLKDLFINVVQESSNIPSENLPEFNEGSEDFILFLNNGNVFICATELEPVSSNDGYGSGELLINYNYYLVNMDNESITKLDDYALLAQYLPEEEPKDSDTYDQDPELDFDDDGDDDEYD